MPPVGCRRRSKSKRSLSNRRHRQAGAPDQDTGPEVEDSAEVEAQCGDDDLVGNYPHTLVPEESLDLFAGGDAQGSWTLLVRDAGERDVGILRSWSLNLSCR
jgi:hypothetical protein